MVRKLLKCPFFSGVFAKTLEHFDRFVRGKHQAGIIPANKPVKKSAITRVADRVFILLRSKKIRAYPACFAGKALAVQPIAQQPA